MLRGLTFQIFIIRNIFLPKGEDFSFQKIRSIWSTLIRGSGLFLVVEDFFGLSTIESSPFSESSNGNSFHVAASTFYLASLSSKSLVEPNIAHHWFLLLCAHLLQYRHDL